MGTEIFWITIIYTFTSLFIVTLIGRPWVSFLPFKQRAPALFYMAPSLGLAILTFGASILGRLFPLGAKSVALPIFGLMLFYAYIREKNLRSALQQAVYAGFAGIICGASILAPLFIYGAYNYHNDAFTYLVHSNWLQTHAFSELINSKTVTPVTTQVYLYQQGEIRMGASFLLALFQSLFNLQFSSYCYPALVISLMTSCCLSLGFPIHRLLKDMKRNRQLLFLALPALSFGGIVFGSTMGFLPQTAGLSFCVGLLLLAGVSFPWIAKNKPSIGLTSKIAVPSALFFVATTFAYSEIVPFLIMSLFIAGLIIAYKFNAWKSIGLYGFIIAIYSIVGLNLELTRAFHAILIQSKTVVGAPVLWNIMGYLAHSFGIHGGVTDIFRWIDPQYPINLYGRYLGGGLLTLFIVILVLRLRSIKHAVSDGSILPVVVFLTLMALAFIYFRYVAPSPFPVGKGQTWSQFKLSDWAHPFMMILLLLAFVSLRPYCKSIFDKAVAGLFLICFFSTVYYSSPGRLIPQMQPYTGVKNLNQFFKQLREAVYSQCPPDAPVYLALPIQYNKVKQQIACTLFDRDLISNWDTDGYISSRLPAEKRFGKLAKNVCVIELLSSGGILSQQKPVATVGPLRVGFFAERELLLVDQVKNAYPQEIEGENQWYWVKRRISFNVEPLFISSNTQQVKLHFEYLTRDPQKLTISIYAKGNTSQQIILIAKQDENQIFDQIIDIPPTEISRISIKTDGKPYPLRKIDPRLAAWRIRNFSIEPVSG